MSLSISTGLFIFLFIIYVAYLFYNLIFGGETSADGDLGFLDELEEEVVEEKEEEKEEEKVINEEKEEVIGEEEVNKNLLDGEDMEEVV